MMKLRWLCIQVCAVIVVCASPLSPGWASDTDSRSRSDHPPLLSPGDFVLPRAPLHEDALSGEAARTIRTGVLLIATDRVKDASLRNAVILVVRHLTSGTRGIVINRPTRMILGEVKVELAGEPGDTARIHYGGPVNARTIRYLLRGSRNHFAEARITDNVWFGTREEALDQAASQVSGNQLRLFAGHVSWAQGALDQELAHGEWLLAPATTASLFSRDPGGLWQRLMKRSRHNDLVSNHRTLNGTD